MGGWKLYRFGFDGQRLEFEGVLKGLNTAVHGCSTAEVGFK